MINAGILDGNLIDGEEEIEYGFVYIVKNQNWSHLYKFGYSINPDNAYYGKGRYVPMHEFEIVEKFACTDWKRSGKFSQGGFRQW